MTGDNVEPGAVDAPWRGYANRQEKQQLAEIEARYRRKKAIIEDEVLNKKRKIMRRCIMRMRRDRGKE